jgi:sortase family protein
MKKDKTTIFLVLVLIVGLSLILYPSLSDYWNSFRQSKAIASYVEAVANLDDDTYEKMLKDAKDYNNRLYNNDNRWHMAPEEEKEYSSLLNVAGNGIIGYIEIGKINVQLPLYHGVDDTILQVAVGHLPGSSLPIGGENTHSVLSGHRGLPSAKLFTDLDKIVEGDTFVIRVLDETFTYEVDQILIVLPNDISALSFMSGADLCTLITCTPYGVNSHRLLVRGHRVANADDSGDIRITADAMQIEPIIVAPIVAIPMMIVLIIVLMIRTRNISKNQKSKEQSINNSNEKT